jgi:hypothetical protein
MLSLIVGWEPKRKIPTEETWNSTWEPNHIQNAWGNIASDAVCLKHVALCMEVLRLPTDFQFHALNGNCECFDVTTIVQSYDARSAEEIRINVYGW